MELRCLGAEPAHPGARSERDGFFVGLGNQFRERDTEKGSDWERRDLLFQRQRKRAEVLRASQTSAPFLKDYMFSLVPLFPREVLDLGAGRILRSFSMIRIYHILYKKSILLQNILLK